MPHPDEGLLHAWLDGELDAASAKRVDALVAGDPAWAAAAAEARGLMAASSRIVRALDHASPNVLPRARPPRSTPRWWMVRIAALVVVVAGTTIVMRQRDPYAALRQPAGTPIATDSTSRAQMPAVTTTAPPASVAAPLEEKRTPSQSEVGKKALAASSRSRREQRSDAEASVPNAVATSPALKATGRLDSPTQREAALRGSGGAVANARIVAADSLRVARAAETGAAAALELRKVDANVAAPASKATVRDSAANRSVPPGVKMEKDVLVRPVSASRCFQVREPSIAGMMLLRFDTTQLVDSLRLRKMTLRGDTLRLEGGRRLAISVPCPDP